MVKGEIAGLGQGLHPAVREIVKEALSRGIGQTMPTNTFFKEAHNIGAGTMQRAINLLQERGAIQLASRGHLGRLIEAIDVGQCWQAAGLDPVRLLLPPAGAVEFDVIADQLGETLTRLGIAHTVHQERGSARRLADIAVGAHDLTAVSSGVVDDILSNKTLVLGPMRRLEAGTYYAQGQLVAVSRAGMNNDARTVAIDRDSADHVALTIAEFPPDGGYTYVDAPFPEVPEWVLRGKADVGIWHRTRTVIPLDLAGLTETQLASTAARSTEERLSGAVLCATPLRSELAAVLPALDLSSLQQLQRTALGASSS